ncbi:hypothetical protein [Cupriavidus metallidurans]|uniref:hypothetical protein n=1 Tax=Cupriavidus metallidurans TaxID=119219 RepID=UPI001CCB1D4B|nr:hypothetical protein [Cupriavidus metallidurans]UBM07934.1 hypothetical protein LAI70_09530 [Cupriavidus metallidurans]
MVRYSVYVGGEFVGTRMTVEAAQALVFGYGQKAEIGARLVFQIKRNGEVIGEGELAVDPRQQYD